MDISGSSEIVDLCESVVHHLEKFFQQVTSLNENTLAFGNFQNQNDYEKHSLGVVNQIKKIAEQLHNQIDELPDQVDLENKQFCESLLNEFVKSALIIEISKKKFELNCEQKDDRNDTQERLRNAPPRTFYAFYTLNEIVESLGRVNSIT